MIARAPSMAVLLLACAASAAQAHTIRPAIATLEADAQGEVRLSVQTNAEALLAGIGPQHADTDDSPEALRYNALRELPPEDLERAFDEFAARFAGAIRLEADGKPVELAYSRIDVPEVGDLRLARLSLIELRGKVPADAGALRFAWPEDFGNVVLKFHPAAGEGASHWLTDGAVSPPLPLAAAEPPGRWEIATQYIGLGFLHILPRGLDHILFVLGIFLLSTRLGPLLWQVTAFTVAHSITLGLAMYGIVALPPAVVEPLIAASIVYVGLENVLAARLRAWRIALVFGFGLLHGLGFAGVLLEIGLPRAEFVTGLIAFNVGVELGQLAVIALALALVGWARRRAWYRPRVVIPASLAIAATGAWWTVERALL